MDPRFIQLCLVFPKVLFIDVVSGEELDGHEVFLDELVLEGGDWHQVREQVVDHVQGGELQIGVRALALLVNAELYDARIYLDEDEAFLVDDVDFILDGADFLVHAFEEVIFFLVVPALDSELVGVDLGGGLDILLLAGEPEASKDQSGMSLSVQELVVVVGHEGGPGGVSVVVLGEGVLLVAAAGAVLVVVVEVLVVVGGRPKWVEQLRRVLIDVLRRTVAHVKGGECLQDLEALVGTLLILENTHQTLLQRLLLQQPLEQLDVRLVQHLDQLQEQRQLLKV